MTDIVSSAVRSRMMSRIRGRDTRPELMLRQALRAAGFVGYRCHYARAPGRPDVAFVGKRVAVFVDGAFWHGHPDHFTFGKSGPAWDDKIRQNIARDMQVNSRLYELGWTVFRVWDFEVLADAAQVVRRMRPLIER